MKKSIGYVVCVNGTSFYTGGRYVSGVKVFRTKPQAEAAFNSHLAGGLFASPEHQNIEYLEAFVEFPPNWLERK